MSEQLFHVAWDRAEAAMALLDGEWKFSCVNESFQTMMGVPEAELKARSLTDVIQVNDVDRAQLRRIVQREIDSYRVTLHHVRKDGGRVASSASITRVEVRGTKPTRFLAQLQLAPLQSETSRSETLHHIRTNLQTIAGILRLSFEQDSLDHRQLLVAARARIQIIASLYDVLDPTATGSSLDFGRFLESHARSLLDRADIPSELHLALDVAPAIMLPVELAVPLGLMAHELLTNALTHAFSHRTVGTISVTLRPLLDGRLRLCIEDDGNGIPEGQPFACAKSVGLRLVHGLAQQVGGELVVSHARPTSVELVFSNR